MDCSENGAVAAAVRAQHEGQGLTDPSARTGGLNALRVQVADDGRQQCGSGMHNGLASHVTLLTRQVLWHAPAASMHSWRRLPRTASSRPALAGHTDSKRIACNMSRTMPGCSASSRLAPMCDVSILIGAYLPFLRLPVQRQTNRSLFHRKMHVAIPCSVQCQHPNESRLSCLLLHAQRCSISFSVHLEQFYRAIMACRRGACRLSV